MEAADPNKIPADPDEINPPPGENDNMVENLVVVSETEKEVEEESYNEFQAQIEVLVQLGKEDLRPFTLSDCYTSDRPGMHLEILPKIIFDAVDEDTDIEEIDLPKPIYRQTVDTGTQASIECKTNEAQTLKRSLVNAWSQYESRTFTDVEIKETVNSSSFVNFIKKAEEGIIGSLIQNSIADSFFRDLLSLHDEKFQLEEEEELQLTISGSFSCSNSKEADKLISSIDWHPLHKDIFAASTISCLSYENRIEHLLESRSNPMSFYVWSVRNQFFSKMTFESLDDAYILKFNPKIPNLIAAGTVTGQLILWDVKQKDSSEEKNIYALDNSTAQPVIQYCAVSSMDHIHKHGITDMHWVPNHLEIAARGDLTKNPSNGYQIMTCGLDGFIQIWDLRTGFYIKPGQTGPKKFHHLDGTWEPFHSVEVFAREGRKRKSLTRFVLRNFQKVKSEENINESNDDDDETDEGDTYENTEFYGGDLFFSKDGQVLCGTFKLMKDEGKFVAKRSEYYQSPHGASVTAVSCSPFINDLFFTTGGRNVAIWKHDIKVHPIYLLERHTYITAGQWSPSRPALFVLGFKDGSIEVWDLLHNLYEPLLVHFVSTSAIQSLSIQSITETEHLLAAGDCKGVVYTLYFPPGLYTPVEDEMTKFNEIMDKEAKRILEKSKQSPESNIPKKDKSKDKISQPSKSTINTSKEEKTLLDAYEAFLTLQKEQLRHLRESSETEIIQDQE